DGKFEDWEDISSYQDRTTTYPNTNSNIDITEYKMVSEYTHASFYIKTAQPIFQGQQLVNQGIKTDTVHIFIDSDQNKYSGYSVGGIGADALIKIDGYNNRIRSADYYMYDTLIHQDQSSPHEYKAHDWNSWSKLNSVPAKSKDNELELKAYLGEMNGDFDVYLNTLDGDGNYDFSDWVISNQKGTLTVDQLSIGGDILPKGSTENEVLKFTLKAEGADIVVEAVSLNLEGTGSDTDITTVKLYIDINNDFGFSSTIDELLDLSLNGFVNKNTEFELSPPLEIQEGQTETLFVTLDISPSATTYNTIGTTVTDINIAKGAVTGIDYLEGSKKSYIDSVPTDRIIIDGAFNDWDMLETVESYSDLDNDFPNKNVDLTEYKFNQDSEYLSLYFKVAGKMLDGERVPASSVFISTVPQPLQPEDTDGDGVPDVIDPNPNETPRPRDADDDGLYDDFETVIHGTDPNKYDTDGDDHNDYDDYYPLDPTRWKEPLLPWILGQDQANIFIDTDLNPSTGYHILDLARNINIGAEYMIEITGKYGHVLNRHYYKYNGEGQNWNWNLIGGVKVGKDSSQLETQLKLSELGLIEGQDYNIYFYISDWNKNSEDYSELITLNNETRSTSSGRTRSRGNSLKELDAGHGAKANDRFGWNVSYAGDVNNDGFSDIIVSAPYNDSADGSKADAGAAYIFSGYTNIDLNNISAAYANVSIYGENAGDHFGWSVSDLGNVDSDTKDDIIIGAPDAGSNGKAYIFYGRASWSSSYTAANADVTITGENSGNKFGRSVSGAGDFDDSGYNDIIVGAPNYGTYVGDWWNTDWSYRMNLTFDNSDQTESLTNFPVLVNLSSSNFDYSKAKSDGSDLRFIDADNTTVLNYEIEEWDTSGYSYVWVNVTGITGSSATDHIWMYYNNSGASSGENPTGV
ncbi:MAG: DUF2341 domain-containing protein, partial [Thermoplasmata archaeon]|nr:DUF2341 domain-containing protein [Thermoplasmata archaeon]